MQKKHLLIVGALVVLVGGGLYLAPDTGNQGFLVKQNFQTPQANKEVQLDSNKLKIQKPALKIDKDVTILNLDSPPPQNPEPEPVEEEQLVLPSFQSVNEDGVVYYSGECLPQGTPGGTVVFDSVNGGGEYPTYVDMIKGLAAEIDRFKPRHINARSALSFKCPYLVELYTGRDQRLSLRYVCHSAEKNVSVDGNEVEVRCHSYGDNLNLLSTLAFSTSPNFTKPLFGVNNYTDTFTDVKNLGYKMIDGTSRIKIVRLPIRTTLDNL